MSQARNKRQNNLRAGIFVSVTLILGLGVITILTDAWSRMTTTVSNYKVTFPVSEGIGTLSSGSKVRLGGVLVGDVLSVIPRVEVDAPTSYIEVAFEIDKQFTLYTNASVHARSGLLGSTGWLAISNVGDGEIASASTDLKGSTTTVASQLLGEDAEENISKTLEALRKISEALSNDGEALAMIFGEEESKSLQEAIRSAKSSLQTMDSILISANSMWPEWEDSISSILAASKELPTELHRTLQQVQQVIQDVRSNILPNVEQSIQLLNTSMQSLESISTTYKKNAPVWASKISGIVQNISQISIRAQRAIDEISASPWRLLYRPTDREISYEQLNAASWKLLTALSELKESADMLREVSLSSDAPGDAATIAESLQESAISFEKARSELLERMELDFPNR